MSSWSNIPIIDALTMAAPGEDEYVSGVARDMLRDKDSLAAWPRTDVVSYLFGGAEDRTKQAADPALIAEEQEKWGIKHSLVMVDAGHAEKVLEALAPFGDQFYATLKTSPFASVQERRRYAGLVHDYPAIRSCSVSPFNFYPPTPINSKDYYVLYASVEDMGVPIMVNVGIPGPRVPGLMQDPGLLDEICWRFPDLTVVMKHGGEPWEAMCVKLMLKWPNLYYLTSAFLPRWYPDAIVKYMNTRGADKVMFAGYWPLVSYDKLFDQMESLQLKDAVWPKFLYENAARVFGLPAAEAPA